MRKIILYFHMSLDNVVSDTENWMQMSDQVLQSSYDFYKTVDTAIFGSNTAKDIADYWKNAEIKPTSPTEQKYAVEINTIKKLVISRSADTKVDWNNMSLLHFKSLPEFKKELESLKQKPGKNISVESGLGIWHIFLEHGLFDEIFVTIHPAVAGKGEKIFSVDTDMYKLDLKNKKVFDNGAVELHYTKSQKDASK